MTLHSLSLCRLTLACISSEIPIKLRSADWLRKKGLLSLPEGCCWSHLTLTETQLPSHPTHFKDLYFSYILKLRTSLVWRYLISSLHRVITIITRDPNFYSVQTYDTTWIHFILHLAFLSSPNATLTWGVKTASPRAYTFDPSNLTYIFSNYTRMLGAILNKSWRQHPTKHQLYGHLPSITKTIKVRRTRHARNCWRSRDELISDVILWIPSHGRAKAGRPTRNLHTAAPWGYGM